MPSISRFLARPIGQIFSGGGRGIRSIEGYVVPVTYTFFIRPHRSQRAEMQGMGTFWAQEALG